jgi:thiamine biosynthesis lipoprotein
MPQVLDPVVHVEPAMGTVVSLHVHDVAGGTDVRFAIEAACQRLHELDAMLSLWAPTSPMSRVRAGELDLSDGPEELRIVLTLCWAATMTSGGWFDPWAMPGGVDPTGLAKGWILEQTIDVLRVHGVRAAMVNGGGDVALLGNPWEQDAWRIGIQHPWRRDAMAAVLEVQGAIATSGSYERGAHLVDPFTGRPAEGAASSTVVGTSLAMADALSTGLAVGGDAALDVVRSLEGYEGYLIRSDGTEASTPGICFADRCDPDSAGRSFVRSARAMPGTAVRALIRNTRWPLERRGRDLNPRTRFPRSTH